jgi:hypothetical protein
MAEPKHIIKNEQCITFFKILGYCFMGDYDAKRRED